MIEMPEPIVEGCVSVYFDRSSDDPQRVRVHITIDYGKTDLMPEIAAEKNLCIIRAIRKQFGVSLKSFKD